MTYRIEGLAPDRFADLFELDDETLAAHRALRVTADESGGFPCRVSLTDAAPGEELLLLNHVSNDVEGPFRTAHAIYVRRAATTPGVHADATPDYLDRRTIGLRGFDSDGMLRGALLAQPGEADNRIRELFARPEVATIHAHTAALGCFLARIERN